MPWLDIKIPCHRCGRETDILKLSLEILSGLFRITVRCRNCGKRSRHEICIERQLPTTIH